MSRGAQSGSIDGLTFARDRDERSGRIDAAALPRASELGAVFGPVDYRVVGIVAASGKPGLRIEAAGTATMLCQRCLAPTALPIRVASELELAVSQAAIDATDDDVDRVVAGPAMDVQALVEDELILALPMVPRHDGCVATAGGAPAAARASPFAALAGRGRKLDS
jgi:uncharacterized protein